MKPTRDLTKGLLMVLAVLALGALQPLGAQSKKDPKSYVQVTPDAGTLQVGQQGQLRAAVLDPVGFDLAHRKVTWRSSDESIATVNSTGLVTALAPGAVTIVAKSGAALGTAAITVQSMNTAPILTILEPGDGLSFAEGTVITFKASAGDMEDGDLNPAILWTVASATDPDAPQLPLGTGATVTSSLARGSYLVTAGVTDFGGLGVVKQIGVTIGCSVVADMQPGEGLKIPQQLRLDARGSYDTCGRPLQYYWLCASDTSVECPDFETAANANGNTNPTPDLNLQEFDLITVGVKVCVAGTNECSPLHPPLPNGSGGPGSWGYVVEHSSLHHVYEGAPVDLASPSATKEQKP